MLILLWLRGPCVDFIWKIETITLPGKLISDLLKWIIEEKRMKTPICCFLFHGKYRWLFTYYESPWIPTSCECIPPIPCRDECKHQQGWNIYQYYFPSWEPTGPTHSENLSGKKESCKMSEGLRGKWKILTGQCSILETDQEEGRRTKKEIK